MRESIQDIVDALFLLPDEQVKDPEHPPAKRNWRLVHGRVRGRLYMMAGKINGAGEWLTAEIVAPAWPPT